MAITSITAKTTSTAAANGSSLAITGITGDWTLVLEIQAMNADNLARFAFTDSVDAFTNKLSGPTVSAQGAIVSSGSRRYSFKKQDFPSLRFGVASAVLRLELQEIKGGASQSVTYQAWLEV